MFEYPLITRLSEIDRLECRDSFISAQEEGSHSGFGLSWQSGWVATYVVLPFILPSISYFCQQFPRPFHHSFLFVTSSPTFPSIFITFRPLYSSPSFRSLLNLASSLPVSLAFQGFIYACGGRRVVLNTPGPPLMLFSDDIKGDRIDRLSFVSRVQLR